MTILLQPAESTLAVVLRYEVYAKHYEGIPTVSDVQAYLDLAARGGCDQKQADYLFDNAIEPMWKAA